MAAGASGLSAWAAARSNVGIATAISWLRRACEAGERTARLREEHVVEIRRRMLSRWLRQRSWTFKKRPPMHWSRNVPTY